MITENTTQALVVVYAFGEFDAQAFQLAVAESCSTVEQFAVKEG